MLKDIKNVMGTKRSNSDSHASILDTRHGIRYEVKTDEKFFIGRAMNSSILIEELYISRKHSIINYENDEFVLYDNDSSSGTYLNYSKLINKKATLKDGDVISYTNTIKTWEFVYLFKISSNSKKKYRLDNESTANGNNTADNKLKELVKNLQDQVVEFKIDKLVLYDYSKTQINEYKMMINSMEENASNISKALLKQNETILKLQKTVSMFHKKYKAQKKLLDAKIVQQEDPLESFKTQINKLLESEFQCPICNEVMMRANVANCHHTFCEKCIKQWLSKSKFCPVCRGIVQNVYYCLALDGFLTLIYDTLGGKEKEIRAALQHERILEVQPNQTARRGRRRANQPRRGNIMGYGFPMLDVNIDFPRPVIEVVDLTHSMSL